MSAFLPHETNGVHHATDEAIDELYSWWPGLQTPPPAPCPEAAFSLTLKGTLAGVEALCTVRGQTPAEFKANLAAVRGLLDAPKAPQAPSTPQGTGKDYCAIHNVTMQLNTKEGRSWWSHRTTEGQWCKGR